MCNCDKEVEPLMVPSLTLLNTFQYKLGWLILPFPPSGRVLVEAFEEGKAWRRWTLALYSSAFWREMASTKTMQSSLSPSAGLSSKEQQQQQQSRVIEKTKDKRKDDSSHHQKQRQDERQELTRLGSDDKKMHKDYILPSSSLESPPSAAGITNDINQRDQQTQADDKRPSTSIRKGNVLSPLLQ